MLADIVYDAVWAVAFALNKTATMIATMDDDEIINVTECGMSEGALVPLHLFNYSNGLLGCVIRWNLQRTSFDGVSVRQRSSESEITDLMHVNSQGPVAFEDGDRVHRSIRLQQYREGENGE